LIFLGVGSTHDSSVLRRTDFWNYPERYFHDASCYIIGDGAYPLSNYLIKPFNKPQLRRGNDPLGHRALFNKHLSSVRVNVEHVFGLMKMRFPLLRRMAVTLDETPESHERAIRYLRVACCLHNFLLDMGDDWELNEIEQREARAHMDVAYINFAQSGWRHFAQNNGGVANRAYAHQLQLGERKREYLIDQVLEWPGEARRRPGFWWYE